MPDKKNNFPVEYAWPPLVEFQLVPLIVRLRDIIITSIAWVILIVLLRSTVILAIDWVSHPFGELSFMSPPDWMDLWNELSLFVYIISGLILWLVYYGVLRRNTLKARKSTKSQPSPLPLEVEASLYRLPEEIVRRWRTSKQLTLAYHFENSRLGEFEEIIKS